ncbi:MAG: hypothetical protein JNL74_10200, partial [Fibrobacteres bacterium]|nr:hypothetical protein [Fibrobacterota bacterium]
MRHSFTTKIVVALVGVLLISMVGFIVAFIGAGDASKAVNDVVRIQKMGLLIKDVTGRFEYETELIQYLAEDDHSKVPGEALAKLSAQFAETVKKINENAYWLRDNESLSLRKAVENHNQFTELFRHILGREKPVTIGEMKKLRLYLEKSKVNFEELLISFDARLISDADKTSKELDGLGLKLVFLALFALSFSIVVGIIFVRSFAVPLQRLKYFVAQVGTGDFEADVSTARADTEIKELIESFHDMAVKLKNYRNDLVRSEQLRTIELLAAGVSHEINNPLMIVSGNAEFIRSIKAVNDPELQERMTTIIDECDRMAGIV